eukprot:6062271-Prymnesium_polylepis.1
MSRVVGKSKTSVSGSSSWRRSASLLRNSTAASESRPASISGVSGSTSPPSSSVATACTMAFVSCDTATIGVAAVDASVGTARRLCNCCSSTWWSGAAGAPAASGDAVDGSAAWESAGAADATAASPM